MRHQPSVIDNGSDDRIYFNVSCVFYKNVDLVTAVFEILNPKLVRAFYLLQFALRLVFYLLQFALLLKIHDLISAPALVRHSPSSDDEGLSLCLASQIPRRTIIRPCMCVPAGGGDAGVAQGRLYQ